MSPKVQIDAVAQSLKNNKAEPDLLRAVIEELNLLLRAEAEDEKAPAIKKQFVVIVSDPEGRFPKEDFAAWVIQIPDSESPVTALDRVYRGACEFNASKKGRLMPARTVGDAMGCVPAKHFKESEVWIKTKEPVLVLVSNNLIPTDKTAAASCDEGGVE